MADWLYILRLTRAGAFEAPTEEEERSIEAHFQRLQQAREAGILVLAGPCLDGTFGVVIFRASHEGEARAFLADDPAIRDGVMSADLHPFHISLLGTHQRMEEP